MSDQCHSLLKEYANAWNMTMSEVMYECTRHHIHKHSNTCEYIDVLFRFKDVKKDKRLSKDCYSCACFSCNHITSCRTGIYQGNWEINPGLESYAGTNYRNRNNKQYYLLLTRYFLKTNKKCLRSISRVIWNSLNLRTLLNQENSYKVSKLSRFIDQANEAIYFVEERERLGIKITDADHSHQSKKNKKKITRIRKSYTNLRQSDLIEHAKEAISSTNNE